MTLFIQESFSFGYITLSCISSPALADTLVVQRLAYTPTLPDGMSVDLAAAYRVAFTASFPIHHFSFDFILDDCQTSGSAESGERLDAQSWPIGDGLLMVGTEDAEALQARMPTLPLRDEDYPVEYLPHGFRIAFPYVAPHTNVGFHFVLAHNCVDTESDAEWFAVDVSHLKLSDFRVMKSLSG